MGPRGLRDPEGFLEQETPDLTLEGGVGRLARLREGQKGDVKRI